MTLVIIALKFIMQIVVTTLDGETITLGLVGDSDTLEIIENDDDEDEGGVYDKELLEKILEVAEKFNIDLNALDRHTFNQNVDFFHVACAQGHIDIVERLLEVAEKFNIHINPSNDETIEYAHGGNCFTIAC